MQGTPITLPSPPAAVPCAPCAAAAAVVGFNKSALPSIPMVSVDTKATPPTTLLNKVPSALGSTQAKSLKTRADAQIQSITKRTTSSVVRNTPIDQKHKDLTNKLQKQQTDIQQQQKQRALNPQELKDSIHGSLKTAQMAEKHKRPVPVPVPRSSSSSSSSSSSATTTPAGANANPSLSASGFPQVSFANRFAHLSSTETSASDKSKLDLNGFKEQFAKMTESLKFRPEDAKNHQQHLQNKISSLQNKTSEDLNTTLNTLKTGITNIESMKSMVDTLTSKVTKVAENGSRAGNAMEMMSELVQGIQNVTSDPSQVSTAIQRGPLSCMYDPITSKWFQDVEDQHKRNAAKTMIVREDEWWLNENKKKQAALEWTDLVLQSTNESCNAYVVGQAYSGMISQTTLIVGKMNYYAHTATFEVDGQFNRGALKTNIFNTFTLASQVLLYSSPDHKNDILLILGTTAQGQGQGEGPVKPTQGTIMAQIQTTQKYTAFLLALDSVTGEPVNDFFPSMDKTTSSATWGLRTDSQLYEGSHGVRMSLDGASNELLLLCHAQRRTGLKADLPQLQTVVIRFDKHRMLVSPTKIDGPLVELSRLSSLFQKFTFVGKDISWISSSSSSDEKKDQVKKRFVVCGGVSYPTSQIEETRGFIMMFDETGKPIAPLSFHFDNDKEKEKDKDEFAKHRTTPSGSNTPLASSIGSVPSSPDGFFMKVDGMSSSSTDQKENKPVTPLPSPHLQVTVDVNPMSIAGMSLSNPSVVTVEQIIDEKVRKDLSGETKAGLAKQQQQQPGTKQFHTLNTLRPYHLRPLLAKEKEKEKAAGAAEINNNNNNSGLQLLGSGDIACGTHIVEFADVPNLILTRLNIQKHNGTITFLGTAFPTPNSVQHAFPFVGCLDANNEGISNITVLPSSTHQQTSVNAMDFAYASPTHLYIIGQSFRDPTDSDTSDISLIRLHMQQSTMHIHESCNFRLRGDFHQSLQSIKYSSKLNAMISVGSSQTKVLKAERKGVMTLTAL